VSRVRRSTNVWQVQPALVAGAEPALDLLGVGVAEVGEDRQSRPPGVASRVAVSAGVVALGEVHQRMSLVVSAAMSLLAQPDGDQVGAGAGT